MKICYCEDESAQAMLLKRQVEQWAFQNNTEVNMDLYQSAEEFQFKAFVESYDLILLDIAMNGMNGMELARWIRTTNQEVIIVFVTSDSGFVFEGYEVGAYRYLMKPIEDEKLSDILTFVSAKANQQEENSIVLKIENENRKLYLSQVTFIEVQGHYVNIHMDSGEMISLKSSFDQTVRMMNEKVNMFYATHRSYAANISKVKRIGRTECVLDSEDTLPVSRTAYRELNEAFIRFHSQSI